MTQTTQKEKTLLSPRIPRDTEHERYHPELEEELKECLFCLHRNEMMFDLEVDTDLIEQHIYERQALLARYRYLLGKPGSWGCIQYWKSISRWGKASSLYSLQNTAHRRCDKNLDRIPEPCYPISR